jgi:hypothetical protein
MITINELKSIKQDPTHKDVRLQIERLGLTQREAADLLGVHLRTLLRYLDDPTDAASSRIPFPAYALLASLRR